MREPDFRRPPPLARRHLVRPRVDEFLDDSLHASLTLVSSAAGSGKTEAVAGWLRRRRLDAGWLTLRREDNDPARFWPAFARRVGLTRTAKLRTAHELLEGLGDGAPALVVALDDYHVIEEPAIHRGIDELLDANVTKLRLYIVTRHDPPLALARLRAAGRLCELRFEDLRFDVDEAEGFLNEAFQLALPPQDVKELSSRTEGWVAGLHLAALALTRREERSTFVAIFAGDDRHVSDYVRDEVMATLPDSIREFVLQTSILDRLCAPLCDAVLGATDSQRRIEEVERRNLFLSPLDHQRRWYRYHQLFVEWMRAQSRERDVAAHRRAAEWLAAHGSHGDAIHHYLAAREPERAAALIEAVRWQLVGQGRQRTLAEWIRALPAGVARARPDLLFVAAWVAYDAGQWDDVRDLLTKLDDPAQPKEGSDQPRRAEVALLTAGRLAALGYLPQARQVAARALTEVPTDDDRVRAGLLLVLGKSLLDAGDVDAAGDAFQTARASSGRSAASIVRVISQCHLSEIARRRAQPELAIDEARDALRFAQEAGLSDHPETAVGHLVLGISLLDEGETAEARKHIARGTELAFQIPYEPRRRFAAFAQSRLEATAIAHPPMREALTPRELALLRLLPTQLTQPEIAGELFVSLNTVKTHARSLYRKLGVRSRHAAVERARQTRLL